VKIVARCGALDVILGQVRRLTIRGGMTETATQVLEHLKIHKKEKERELPITVRKV